MNSLARIRLAAAILGVVFVVSVCGYVVLGYDWTEAVWLVVVTMAGVGYGERSQVDTPVQMFTVVVILFGFTSAAYAFGSFLQLLLAGEIERILGDQRMKHDIEHSNRHTLICGFGRIGQILAADLRRHGEEFVVIERDPVKHQAAVALRYLSLLADATEDESLIRAGVHRALALISVLPNDSDNVFITLTARNLNRDLRIIARAEHPTSERKLRQAGAHRVVMPATIGAQQMARMVTRPTTADLMELVAEQGNLNVEMDELTISTSSPLVGKSVRDAEAARKFRLLVLAIKQVSSVMIFNPEADYVFAAGDILIVMGKTVDIGRFRAEFRV